MRSTNQHDWKYATVIDLTLGYISLQPWYSLYLKHSYLYSMKAKCLDQTLYLTVSNMNCLGEKHHILNGIAHFIIYNYTVVGMNNNQSQMWPNETTLK